MNCRDEEERLDWRENHRYPWRFSPLTMLILLAATLTAVAVVGTLVGG